MPRNTLPHFRGREGCISGLGGGSALSPPATDGVQRVAGQVLNHLEVAHRDGQGAGSVQPPPARKRNGRLGREQPGLNRLLHAKYVMCTLKACLELFKMEAYYPYREHLCMSTQHVERAGLLPLHYYFTSLLNPTTPHPHRQPLPPPHPSCPHPTPLTPHPSCPHLSQSRGRRASA